MIRRPCFEQYQMDKHQHALIHDPLHRWRQCFNIFSMQHVVITVSFCTIHNGLIGINVPLIYVPLQRWHHCINVFLPQNMVMTNSPHINLYRALCRIKLLSVTRVFVDTWMLTVKPVHKLLKVFDDLKWTTNTRVTPFLLTFKVQPCITNNIYGFERPFFLAPSFFIHPRPVHHICTRPYSFLPVKMTGGRVST